MTQRHKVSKRCWKDGADRLAPSRVATNLQSVKNAVSAKCNAMRSVCIRKKDPNYKIIIARIMNDFYFLLFI